MVLTFYLIGVLYIRRDTVIPKNNPKFFERLFGNPTKSLQNLVWKFQNVPTIQERRYITTLSMIGYC